MLVVVKPKPTIQLKNQNKIRCFIWIPDRSNYCYSKLFKANTNISLTKSVRERMLDV